MTETLLVLLRGGVLLAFLIVMPIIALPVVGRSYDAWLLGEANSGVRDEHPLAGEDALQPAPFAPREIAADSPSSRPNPEPPRTGAGDRFEAVSRRLKELDVEYMRLEAADARGEQFHFHCHVPLGNETTYSRPFEALAADPVAAMERVLAEVEAWRAAREHSPRIRAATRRP